MAVLEHLTPRLAADLERVPLPGGGLVLLSADGARHVELAAEDLAIVEALDGATSLSAVAQRLAERRGEPGFRRLVPLCRDLALAGLLTLPAGATWPAEWGIEAGLAARPGRHALPRLSLTSPAAGALCTRILSGWRGLPRISAPVLGGLLAALLAGLTAFGGPHASLPQPRLAAAAPHLDATFALTLWLGFGLAQTVREKLRAAATLGLGGRVRRAGLALRRLAPVLVMDASDAARAGSVGRLLVALAGLAGSALGTSALWLCASLCGDSPVGYGLAGAGLLAGAELLADLCPLLPGDAGAALAEMAPDDRFAPRLRSFLARGVLRGMLQASAERRGLAIRPDEERFYLFSALAAGLWTAGALAVLDEVSDHLGASLLAPAAATAELPLAANLGAGALLAALALAQAAAVALALSPPLLWAFAALRPGRARRTRPVGDAAPPSSAELGRYPLFGRLSPAALEALARATELQRFKAGDVIVRQGDPGDAFFAIRSGDAEVLVEDATGLRRRVSTLTAGDAFGELALVDAAAGGRRKATVRAAGPLVALRLGRTAFERALSEQALPASEVTELLRETHLLARLPFFADFSADALAQLSLALKPQPVAAGEIVVRQGERGEHFYVVQSGGLDVHIDGQLVGHLGPGECFGEVALLQRVPRMATVTATEASHLMRLAEDDFMRAVDGSFRFGEHLDALSVRRLNRSRAGGVTA